jgi:hypothetical protein
VRPWRFYLENKQTNKTKQNKKPKHQKRVVEWLRVKALSSSPQYQGGEKKILTSTYF